MKKWKANQIYDAMLEGKALKYSLHDKITALAIIYPAMFKGVYREQFKE